MLHDGAVVVGARVVVGACVVAGALVVVVTRAAVVGGGLEDWVSAAQLAMRRKTASGATQRFMLSVFQTPFGENRGAGVYTEGLRCRPTPLQGRVDTLLVTMGVLLIR